MVFGNFMERGLKKLGSLAKDVVESKYAKGLSGIGNMLIEKLDPKDILNPIISGFERK